jgi:hypothetical protein
MKTCVCSNQIAQGEVEGRRDGLVWVLPIPAMVAVTAAPIVAGRIISSAVDQRRSGFHGALLRQLLDARPQ